MSIFVFAECNQFFVACERLFNPSLEGKPVIILSPERHIIALSEEATKLGLKVDDPYLKIKAFCARMNVVIFDSNDKLYSNVSHRIMNLLSSAGEEIDIQAVDHAYLQFSSHRTVDSVMASCQTVRDKIRKWIGIPISMGVAPTRILARIANQATKRVDDLGVFDLTTHSRQKALLENLLLEEISDMEPRMKERFHVLGIRSAWELSQMDPAMVKRTIGTRAETMLWELRGVNIAQKTAPLNPNHGMMLTKSFDRMLRNQKELIDLMSAFFCGASLQLHDQACCVKAIHVSLEAILDENQGSRSTYNITSSLPTPTNDENQLMIAAKQCLNKLFSPHERYTRCEVQLLDLVPVRQVSPLVPYNFTRKRCWRQWKLSTPFSLKISFPMGSWTLVVRSTTRRHPTWDGKDSPLLWQSSIFRKAKRGMANSEAVKKLEFVRFC